MKKLTVMLALMMLCFAMGAEAKSYKFKITDQRNVSIKRSGQQGMKIVEVVAQAGSVDGALDKALVDAAVAMTFDGVPGQGYMDPCPPVLKGGKAAYEARQKWFDRFFKKGEFTQFVRRASGEYPTGTDNIKVGGSRQVRVVIIVDWDRLAQYFESQGMKTNISNLLNY